MQVWWVKMVITPAKAEKAKGRVTQILRRLFGPNLQGVVAFGVRYDLHTHDLCVGVDLELSVPTNLVREIPRTVESVPIQVNLREPPEMD